MMFLNLPTGIGTLVARLLFLGASLQQAGNIPWWWYLVGLSVLLLLLFVIVVALAWRDANRPNGEG
jgi:hypothetical protein